MITKEQAIEYLDRIVEAKALLDTPLLDDPGVGNVIHYLYDDDKSLLIFGTEKLAKALGHPYRLSSFSDSADKLSFRWKGIEIYELHCGKRKRIAHIERG